MPFSPRLRRAVFASAALGAALISCGREMTAPSGALTRFARGLSFIAQFPTAYQVAGGSSVVPFTKVHIVLLHPDGKVALDTTVNWPDGADQLTLNLTVPLAAGTPASGENMSATLAY